MTIYKKYAKAYDILRAGDIDYTGNEPIKHIHARFLSEAGWNIERVGKFRALTEWLQGLALNIPYMNADIMDTFGLTEKQLESYWRFMAMRLNELFEKEGV